MQRSAPQTRNSSVELLKVIAILMIVTSHVIQTLQQPPLVFLGKYEMLNLNRATENIQYLLLSMLQCDGVFGTMIFFVCSAWFMIDSSKVNKRKLLQFAMDIWFISVLILIAVMLAKHGELEVGLPEAQLFPITYGNNWYMTCYILFYPIHPLLNTVMRRSEKTTHLRIVLAMLFVYFGINFFNNSAYFFVSHLILWIAVYFTIGYIKLYLADFADRIKPNVILFAVGFIGNYGLMAVTNVIGLHDKAYDHRLMAWAVNHNLFILMMSIGLLNIARNIHFQNKIINYISGLSMLIYIIHENVLLRIYYRPPLWQYVYENFGYAHILLWTFIIIAIVFVFGLTASILYRCTLQKLVTKVGDKLYPIICKWYHRLENNLLKLH